MGHQHASCSTHVAPNIKERSPLTEQSLDYVEYLHTQYSFELCMTKKKEVEQNLNSTFGFHNLEKGEQN